MIMVGVYFALGVGVALGIIRTSEDKDLASRAIIPIVWGLFWPIFIMAIITVKLIDG